METHAIQTITIGLVAGVSSYILARRLKIPAVLFYLFSGILLGPVGLGFINTQALGSGLLTLVEIGVAIILFEGGLSLSTHSFKAEAAGIRRILALTVPLTGFGAALLARYLLDISWQYAIFFGAVIVVTGPTVIGSLLRSVNLTRRLEILLNWESIWGDVIGVLMSAIALELITLDVQSNSYGHLVLIFFLRIVEGAGLGALSGYLMAKFLLPAVMRLRDPALPGIAAVAGGLATFFIANTVLESSGPLAVAVAGFFLSYLKVETLHEIRHFKDQLASIFISMLFVLLSAYIDPLPFAHLWPKMLLLAFVLGAFVRPAAVLLALGGTTVTWPERLFIGLIGPRGIIAVATMSYAAFTVTGNMEQMNILLILTFAIIFFSGATSTILCKPLARMLKVMLPISGSGILLVGANAFTASIANFARQHVTVAILDRDPSTCSMAGGDDPESICGDLLDASVYEDAAAEGFGRVLALTNSDAMNELITQRAAIHLGQQFIFRVLVQPFCNSVICDPNLGSNIAFSKTFHLNEVVSQLENGMARVEVLSPEAINNNDQITPLLQIVDNGKGIRIVRPGQSVENDTLCFVPNDSNKD